MKENRIEEDIKIIEKYLSHFKKVCSPEMLKKDEIIKVIQYKEIQALQHILTNYKRVLKDNKLRDKTIKLMAEYIESKNLLIDKNFHVLTAESIKECFKNKAKRSDFFDQGRKESNIEIVLNLLEKLQEENEQLKNEVMEKNLEIQELLESEE